MPEPTPEGWQWGIGESSDTYYDAWAYHDDYELHLWWDKGNSHSVELIPIEGYHDNGDPIRGYEMVVRSFETEQEAEEFAYALMEKYT